MASRSKTQEEEYPIPCATQVLTLRDFCSGKTGTEAWKKIQGWPLWVSDHGRLYFEHKKKIEKSNITNKKYYAYVKLREPGKVKAYSVHKLVLVFFGSPQPTPQHQVNHKDGNRHNNHISNLEWVTPKQNYWHARNIGLFPPFKNYKKKNAKIEKALPEIIPLWKSGYPLKELANTYNLNPSTLYKHLPQKRTLKRRPWITGDCMEDEYTLAKDLGYTGPSEWLRSEYWGHGRSTSDIAEDADVTPKTIQNWLHRHQIPVRPRGGKNVRPGYSKCLAALREIPNLEQYTAQQLSERTGFCRKSIQYAAARYGLKIAKRNPPIIHRLQRLDTQNLTMKEIRNLLPEYHPATIRTALYRAGMSWRKRGQQ